MFNCQKNLRCDARIPAIAPFAPKSASAITLGNGVNLSVSIAPLVQAYVEGGGYYGYPVGVTQSLVYLSSERSSCDWMRIRFSSAMSANALYVPVPLTAGPINYFQAEGRALLAERIKLPCEALILILTASDRKGSLAHKEIVPLLEKAYLRCNTVNVIFQGLSAEDSACLTDYFETVLNIEECEPDFGYTSAFTVAPAPGTLLAAIGKRPVIDNIRIDANGQIERNHYDCVSPSAMNREIAKLIEQGKSYTEIAELFDVNKSTIMRRVDSLPLQPRRHKSKGIK